MAKYVTKSGVVLDDAAIERLADEAEIGFEHHELISEPARGRPSLGGGSGPSPAIQVRVDADLAAALQNEADRQEISRSEYIRSVLRKHVPTS